jgi:hypothetical protein
MIKKLNSKIAGAATEIKSRAALGEGYYDWSVQASGLSIRRRWCKSSSIVEELLVGARDER